MKKLIQTGNQIQLSSIDESFEKLPKGTYNLKFDTRNGFYYLEITDPLQLPNKIYGDNSIIDRYINTYKHRNRNLGVLFNGLKGNGKTILSKLLCLKLDQPLIIINEQFYDDEAALTFLTNPQLGDCTILIDEYEKKFSAPDSETSMLTLLDGPYNTHHFYILTCNEPTINKNLINRPSRIYYTKNFNALDNKLITDVINDLLVETKFKDSLENLIKKFPNMSYDILVSIINDINLYKEDAFTVARQIGLCLEQVGFDVYVKDPSNRFICTDSFRFNGINEVKYVDYWVPNEMYLEHPCEDNVIWKRAMIEYSNIPEISNDFIEISVNDDKDKIYLKNKQQFNINLF